MNVSAQAATAAAASDVSQQPRQAHRPQQSPKQGGHGTSGGIGGHDLSLPWLADRFYLNVIPAVRESERNGQGEDWKISQDTNVKSESNRSGSKHDGGGDSVGRGYANGPFFSLERLVDVVSGKGGPGIKAAIFGTMSLQIGRLAEEIPSLFSRSNLTVPVLVLHGEKSLRRLRDSSAEVINTTRGEAAGGGGGGKGGASDYRTNSDHGADYILFRESLGKNASSEQRERLKAAGREDRLDYWEMSMPAHVQVEKVHTGGLGVHHPKFGLLFLKDDSLVVYVGTGNLGVDTAIDATWVQRFGQSNKGEAACTRDLDNGGTSEWKGDFGVTLQAFLAGYSRLMRQDPNKKVGTATSRRRLRNTPMEFMLRELGIERLGDSFDFRTAAVDLVPTVPTPMGATLSVSLQPNSNESTCWDGGRGGGNTPVESSSRSCWQDPCLASPSMSPLPLLPVSTHQENGATRRGGGGRLSAATGSGDGEDPDDDLDGQRAADSAATSSRADDFDAPDGGPARGAPDTEGGDAIECGGAGGTDLRYYGGQLRMKYLLSKRRGQVEEAGPEDLLILQPTSIGAGIDAGFLEIFAKNLMPDSAGPLRGAWKESRLDSVRIVWPSMQYMGACRKEMSKSTLLRDRQASTIMEVDHKYVMGEDGKTPDWDNNGFVFMSPDQFDGMGLDLHCCLQTFQLHPATALALPLRPAHVKSVMRLRKAPFSLRPQPPSPQKQAIFTPNKNTNTCDRGGIGNSTMSHSSAEGAVADAAAAAAAGGSAAAGRTADVRGDTGCDGARPVVCTNVQHFSWFLLTSACLSKGAQGEVVAHGDRTGTGTAAPGAIFKNVELGVLFHSSPERAYYTAPLPDCACPSCGCSPGSGGPPHCTRTDTRELPPPPPPPSMVSPRSIPLPVPFCLHSEAYTDPLTESPNVRFAPYMHTLKSERPWSVEVQRLLNSNVREAQFA
ncbi:conserved unknown protein [Ectocarpus siliculosus]|uniref:Uncharacterized protein n=1 Tax=Ectocarpus siliculosus TaxID=2880 RepID=D7FP39_ECTSI|nr:conserved unknown protein [Ectocarpus siliculosus]|eukprot:CBJ30303.1 conserved unknown protein [Ectocarpus siliculosus]